MQNKINDIAYDVDDIKTLSEDTNKRVKRLEDVITDRRFKTKKPKKKKRRKLESYSRNTTITYA